MAIPAEVLDFVKKKLAAAGEGAAGLAEDYGSARDTIEQKGTDFLTGLPFVGKSIQGALPPGEEELAQREEAIIGSRSPAPSTEGLTPEQWRAQQSSPEAQLEARQDQIREEEMRAGFAAGDAGRLSLMQRLGRAAQGLAAANSAKGGKGFQNVQALQKQWGEQDTAARKAPLDALDRKRKAEMGGLEQTLKAGEVEDVARERAEANDPDSIISKTARDIAKKAGIPVNENTTAATLTKVLPNIIELAKQQAPKTPTLKDFKVGDEIITKQWNPETQGWDEVSRGPRYKPAGEGGLTSTQMATQVERAEKTIEKGRAALQSISAARRALDDPNSEYGGMGDLAALYGFIRALDPESVVREGEIALSQQGISKYHQIVLMVQKAVQDRTLTGNQRKEISAFLRDMENQMRTGTAATLERRRRTYESLGGKVEAWPDYSSFGPEAPEKDKWSHREVN